jgi:hypothetical protein
MTHMFLWRTVISTFVWPSLHVCDGRSSEFVSEVQNVLHAKAHGTFKTEREAVNPACPHWARMLVFIVHCPSIKSREKPMSSEPGKRRAQVSLARIFTYGNRSI